MTSKDRGMHKEGPVVKMQVASGYKAQRPQVEHPRMQAFRRRKLLIGEMIRPDWCENCSWQRYKVD